MHNPLSRIPPVERGGYLLKAEEEEQKAANCKNLDERQKHEDAATAWNYLADHNATTLKR